MQKMLLIAFLVTLSGCSLPLLPDEDQDTWRATGRIEMLGVDCGGWGLRTPGELYELVGLPDDFKVDELKVHVKIERRRDLVSCTMVGPIVQVLEIEEQ